MHTNLSILHRQSKLFNLSSHHHAKQHHCIPRLLRPIINSTIITASSSSDVALLYLDTKSVSQAHHLRLQITFHSFFVTLHIVYLFPLRHSPRVMKSLLPLELDVDPLQPCRAVRSIDPLPPQFFNPQHLSYKTAPPPSAVLLLYHTVV